ncbi:hypothetical protein EUGRSUZ_B03068 [Eucalyptus grandis]|uniref:Uncharacterized protein n=2 Tax=Eucalyptus grandis TaxID=71139 RepID=A0ACC3LWF2_EUCGR|nr:hypothetical protein EUGRSUZ_B03068 [Eucalyptus grandis]
MNKPCIRPRLDLILSLVNGRRNTYTLLNIYLNFADGMSTKRFPRLLEELTLEASKISSLFCSQKKEALETDMASLKGDKPAGSQVPAAPQAKQDPPKQSGSAPKPLTSKPAPKKAEPKPAQPKKKATGGKK